MASKILLADDHPLVRDGINNLLLQAGFDVVAQVSNGSEAVALARKLLPDVALLDFSMPLLNGIDAAREINRESPGTKTALLTMYQDEPYVIEALRAGIKAYVLKSQAALDLVQAIRAVLEGELYLSPAISKQIVNIALGGGALPESPLTSRERHVLQLVAEGHTNKEIARQLNLSWKTVESHRRNLMAKLDIHETAGLVRHAIKLGLVNI